MKDALTRWRSEEEVAEGIPAVDIPDHPEEAHNTTAEAAVNAIERSAVRAYSRNSALRFSYLRWVIAALRRLISSSAVIVILSTHSAFTGSGNMSRGEEE
jgi:hypothetical protein